MPPSLLEHGGRLRQAARHYQRPLEEWLDLSTGINPDPWPVPPLPQSVWQRLPEEDDGLEAAAAAYYGHPNPLPVAGSQAAIQCLPGLFSRAMVCCLSPLYAEHPHAWTQAGHRVRALSGDLKRALSAVTPYVLLCNPNNPTATHHTRSALLDAAAQLRRRGGWLIVDEAFIDATPEDSVADLAGTPEAPNLVVLRSLGKFFGLAGARVGFVCAAEDIRQRMQAQLGPWTLSGPARYVAQQALADSTWQARTRIQLQQASQRLRTLLAEAPFALAQEPAASPLFVTVNSPSSEHIHQTLAEQGILTRHFPEWQGLRFGLPGSEEEWTRLSRALSAF